MYLKILVSAGLQSSGDDHLFDEFVLQQQNELLLMVQFRSGGGGQRFAGVYQ